METTLSFTPYYSQPPKDGQLNNCLDYRGVTETDNKPIKMLEALSSVSVKTEPNFRFNVDEASVDFKNLFPTHTSTCCSDCRVSQSPPSSIPTNFDPHGNFNNSTGAPISSSTRKPLDGEQPVLKKFDGGNLKGGSVSTASKTEPVKQSCCVIS